MSPIFADFHIGSSCLPIDEEGFIEYDFDKYTAPGPLRLKVEFVDLSKIYEPIEALGANITVSEYNTTTNIYQVSIVDSKKFQNQAFLSYNKTQQYFRYNRSMDILLLNGYGGYYVIPNDPVDLNIVKAFVEQYTTWSANVENNTITIDIVNEQYILTYSEEGLLIKEEVKSNDLIISVLIFVSYTANQNEDIGDFDFLLIILVIFIVAIVSVINNKTSSKNR
ncbi:MAG: hypothetical protein ACFE9S_05480 [Candidatus Hermodarchaeota archaeon]